jgi:predicted nucleic acid-binding protein
MSNIFIDTNILVYCLDSSDRAKKNKCRQLLREISKDRCGVISSQVMQEFYVASTKKLKVDKLIVKDLLHSFGKLNIITVTPDLINEAIDCSIINRLSFWDALIVVTAESANCEKMLSEDLNHGQIIRGVRIENPLIDLP